MAPGTKILLNCNELPPGITIDSNKGFGQISLTVQNIAHYDEETVLQCDSPQVTYHQENRQVRRQPTQFALQREGMDQPFLVTNASLKGLGMTVIPGGKVVLGLRLNETYAFSFDHKGSLYTLDGTVRHIEYDWRDHGHTLGIELTALNPEQETALNMLIDPNYKVDLNFDASVDVGSGKISPQG